LDWAVASQRDLITSRKAGMMSRFVCGDIRKFCGGIDGAQMKNALREGNINSLLSESFVDGQCEASQHPPLQF
jgi:hypothetical protein